MTFSEFFPYETYLTIYNDEKKMEPLNEALLEFLKAKRCKGELKPIQGTENRMIRFANNWTNFLESGEVNIVNFFNTFSTYLFCTGMDERKKKPEEAYSRLIETIDKGDLTSFEIQSDYDFVSGANIYFRAKNWEIKGEYIKDGKALPLVPLPPEPDFYATTVEFKTGNLLASDWFRMTEFNEFTKKLEDDEDINSTHGQVQRTKNYALANIIHVYSGSFSPRIFFRNGGLIIGHTDYEDEPTDEIGSICTDLWWSTILEREKLIEIVGNKTAVDSYISENRVTSFQVEPGVYEVQFEFKEAQKLPGIEEVIFRVRKV